MAHPYKHAQSAAKKWGGVPEDYLEINVFMDCSKASLADNRHRACLHHSFGASVIIPKCFGHFITNSDGIQVSTKDIAERHILEDYRMKFIPTVQDWLEQIQMQPWMNNAMGLPNSAKSLYKKDEPSTDEVVSTFNKD